MAKIVPYGDPNAYGKFGGIVFRRYRNGTVLTTKTKPTYRRTPAQAAVRNLFKEGAQQYNLLTSLTRDFYRARAAQVGICVKDLWMRAYMKGNIPSDIPIIDMKEITKMTIFKTAASKVNGFNVFIEGAEKLPDYGQNIQWCKMESAADIGDPSRGIPGIVYGTVTYPAMKFNNGANIINGAGSIELEGLPPNDLGLRGMKGFWWQPHFSSTDPTDYDLFWLRNNDDTGEIACFYTDFRDGLLIEVNRDGNRLTYAFPFTWAAEELMHILCYWDTDNPAGSRARLWKNGTEITPVVIGDSSWTFPNPITKLLFSGTYGVINSAYDNIKLYNGIDDLDSVLANINNEGFPLVLSGSWIPYAKIEDTSQTFENMNTIEYETNQRIHIQEVGNVGADIPFRYLITMEYIAQDDSIKNISLRLPKIYIAPLSHSYFYLSDDWSDYWDENYWHLACTDII
ncbi:hypothetical protein KAR91_23515 [Candidatus Pacearchaeota archaeon]|nr:hypothetical protein [Candidatus Pacearchaeota archaeon]